VPSRLLNAWSIHRIHGLFQGNACHRQSCIERRGRDECLFPLLEVPVSKRWPAVHRPT